LIAIALAFVAVHVFMGLLDSYRPEVFLRADRAALRLREIHALLAVRSWAEASDYLGTHGVIGDYAAHAVLYAIGGRWGVILCQVLLIFASGLGVVRLARLLGMSPKSQAVSLGLYLVLPHSLVFPHQLSTEALDIPLLVISTWLVCESIRNDTIGPVLISALLLAMATLIRPITLLWPATVFIIAVLHGRRGFGATFLVVAYAPVILWMAFVWQHTGTFGLGESNHSLERNLYLRVAAIAATMPQVEADEIDHRYLNQGDAGRMGAIEYVRAGLDHPVPFLKAAARDTAVFFGKSGIERLTLDYFGSDAQFKALTSIDSGWHKRLDTTSAMTTLRYVWRVMGATLLISLAASALLIAMIALAVYGAIALVREIRDPGCATAARFTAMVLIVLPVYIFVFSLVVIEVQSRQRAPAEFALVILAVYGWQRLSSLGGRLKRGIIGGGPTLTPADNSVQYQTRLPDLPGRASARAFAERRPAERLGRLRASGGAWATFPRMLEALPVTCIAAPAIRPEKYQNRYERDSNPRVCL
jgi:hypothetical protein